MKNFTRSASLIPTLFDGQPANVGKRWRWHLKRALDALSAGSSMVPFGDNGDVFRALAAARVAEDGQKTGRLQDSEVGDNLGR